MSKRKEKDPLSNEANSKKSKTDVNSSAKRKRGVASKESSPTEPTNIEFFKDILTKLDSIELNTSNLSEIITSILKRNGITNRQDETLISIFRKIIHKNEFDCEMFLSMLDQFDKDFLIKHKNLCELLLSSLFMIDNDNKQEKSSTPPSTSATFKSKYLKIFKYHPGNFNDLIKHSFNLIHLSNFSKQSQVYIKIFKIFFSVDFRNEKLIKDKFTFIKAEKALLEKLVDRLKLDPTGLISSEIFKALKTLLNDLSVRSLNNNFLIKIYLSLINEMNDRISHSMTEEILKIFEKSFEFEKISKSSKWINDCLLNPINTRRYIDLFNYNILLQFIPQDKLITNILDFCMLILNKYGVEINQYFQKTSTLQESFTLLASKILQDIFRKSKSSREQIINSLLNRCFTESNRSVFITQLEILLNSDDASRIFYSTTNQEEKSNLCKIAISKLIGQSSTKTRAWNHIFLIDKSNDALRLLKVFRKMFYTQNNSSTTDNLDNLVTFLRSYSNNNSLEIRKIALLGLANIVVELNRDHFRFNSLDIKVAHESCIERNSNISLHIIEHLKNQLVSFENDVFLKSKLYQILISTLETVRSKSSNVNTSESKLFNAVGCLYKTQMDKYIIRTTNSDYAYFNLNKCIIAYDFKLIEPIDVLFHCADIYSTNSLKFVGSGNLAYKTLSSLQFQITQLKKIYIEKDSKFLFDIYKNQLMDKVKAQISPATCMKIIHQLELGFIDVLVEHSINNENFGDLLKILEKYESTSNLISIEIENLMSSIHKPQVEIETGKKRKLETPQLTGLKKPKKNNVKRTASQNNINESSDKENEPASKTRTTRMPRETLQDLSNKTPSVSTKAPIAPKTGISVIQNLSFANIQFEHVHRISSNCCVKMVQIYLGTNDNDLFKPNGSKLSQTVLTSLINLITNETFIEFLIKVTEKKLKLLSNMDLNSEQLYEPQSITDEQIFKFISCLWLPLCQRINGNLTSKKTVYKANIPQRFGVQFLNKSFRFIQCMQLIWSICSKRFQSMKKDLIVNERKYYTSMSFDSYFDPEDDSKLTEYSWEFLRNCSRTLKYHLNPSPATQAITIKCSTALLTLISDITRDINLKQENYKQLMQFLFDLADHRISNDQDFGICVVKFMGFLSEFSGSPVIFVKYLSMDYSNTRYLDHSDDSEDEREPIEETARQFEIFKNQTSFLKYQQLINEQIISMFDKYKMCMNNLDLFNHDSLIENLNSQINRIVLAISYILKSVFDTDTTRVNFDLMIQFYNFLTFYIQSDLILSLTFDGLVLIKALIDNISIYLQSILSNELNRINEFILTNEEQKEETASSSQIINIIKYKENMELLIGSIDRFEQELIRLNDTIDVELNLMENYKNFVSDLKLNVKTRSTRFVSALEIDQILNPTGVY
ncbi:unnamed protein product [Brachionus calyciflorus]|uniref:Uncharacterized protein n=1 Tax=Brachionus calyciflorus TaxID=104777 RepID=A0A814BKH3_9BILA|nr:unnamed protein product [Brachionus calyciflorus]